MLGNVREVLDSIKPTDRVLDVGGGMQPLSRADVVIDIMPYAERGGAGGRIGGPMERFTKDTWVTMDFSGHQKFPFHDKSFDFVFCSHTLEDIADPFWLCAEMNRVGKRGYIETPSRAAESAMGIAGLWKLNKNYFTGYYHHRWFVEDKNGELVFTVKYPIIHAFKTFQVPASYINDKNRYLAFWWTDSFRYREQLLLSSQDAFNDLKMFRLSIEEDPKEKKTLGREMDSIATSVQRPDFLYRWTQRFKRLFKAPQ